MFCFRFCLSFHLRLGVFNSLLLVSAPKLVEPQPITTNNTFDGTSAADTDLVWMQIGLALFATRTGELNFKIATSS